MEYKIVDVKAGNVWESGYGQMQSYTIAIEGVSEPVVLNKKVPVKQEPKTGDTLYGLLEEKTNAKGTVYMKFTAQKPPEATGQAQGSSWHESPEKQQSINRAVALNNAVVYAQVDKLDADKTIEIAELFYSWLTLTPPEEKEEETDTIKISDIPF